MKNDMTPFECGQEDSFFNKEPKPRLIKDGEECTLTSPSEIQQYFNGIKDAEEFYNGC
tara:strand:- start:79 stop:252 length:174 start_codon:yes stop_codon:yes gene_type:complete